VCGLRPAAVRSACLQPVGNKSLPNMNRCFSVMDVKVFTSFLKNPQKNRTSVW
jgi:hypothetical protein